MVVTFDWLLYGNYVFQCFVIAVYNWLLYDSCIFQYFWHFPFRIDYCMLVVFANIFSFSNALSFSIQKWSLYASCVCRCFFHFDGHFPMLYQFPFRIDAACSVCCDIDMYFSHINKVRSWCLVTASSIKAWQFYILKTLWI